MQLWHINFCINNQFSINFSLILIDSAVILTYCYHKRGQGEPNSDYHLVEYFVKIADCT